MPIKSFVLHCNWRTNLLLLKIASSFGTIARERLQVGAGPVVGVHKGNALLNELLLKPARCSDVGVWVSFLDHLFVVVQRGFAQAHSVSRDLDFLSC